MAPTTVQPFDPVATTTSFVCSVVSEGSRDPCHTQQPRNYVLAFAAVVICGTLNNFSFCIISGASQDLARKFGTENMTTALTTVLNFAALSGTVVSTKILSHFQYYTRIVLVLIMTASAYGGIAAAATMTDKSGFWIIAALGCLAGMAQIFGEVSNLAFLKCFPPELVGGWGAGTGLAGIFGSLSYIWLRETAGLTASTVFALCIPLCLVYWIAFQYLYMEAVRDAEGPALARIKGGIPATPQVTYAATNNDPRVVLQEEDASTALPATWANAKAAIRASGNIMFNLVAVYCLEYLIWPGLADRETLCAGKVWYTSMWMCYNVGVTLSRFSVSIFRIRRVWLLTLFQLLNVLLWVVEVYTGLIRDSLPDEHGLYIMACWMVLVGLCGGATYGNCMFLFNTQAGIPDGLRELGVNLGFVMSNIGTTTATLSFLLIDSTIMTKEMLYPKHFNPSCYSTPSS